MCVRTSTVYRFYLNCLYFSTHEPKNKLENKRDWRNIERIQYMYTSFGFQMQWFDLILLHYGNTGDIATCLNNIMQHQPTKQTNKAINKYFGSIQFLVFVFFRFLCHISIDIIYEGILNCIKPVILSIYPFLTPWTIFDALWLWWNSSVNIYRWDFTCIVVILKFLCACQILKVARWWPSSKICNVPINSQYSTSKETFFQVQI